MAAGREGKVLQDSVLSIGAALAAHMGDSRPGLFSSAGWKGKIIARAMASEAFRVALLRFVDVLPAVPDDARAMRLAGEYFDDLGGDAAEILGRGARALTRGGPFGKAAAKMLRAQVIDLARQFILGEDIDAAFPHLLELWREGCGVSVDLLGEATLGREQAKHYSQSYRSLMEAIEIAGRDWPSPTAAEEAGRGSVSPRINVSVKLSALDPLLDAVAWDASLERARAALRPVFLRALELGAHVQVDMEHSALKELTLTAFRTLLEEDAFATGPSCGIVLQTYLKSAPEDLDALAKWARRRRRKITVRLVKGAYWDQEVLTHRARGWPPPVWEHKWQTDRCYETLSVRLLEEREWLFPAFAGHNLRSIAHAAARAQGMGVDRGGYEFQVIYGMAEPLRRALLAEGFNVRAYCPVGDLLPGMAYLVRRLLENTANTSMLRRMYAERGEEALGGARLAELLRPPDAPPAPDTPPAGLVPATPLPPPSVAGFRNQPLTDFAQAPARAAFGAALARARNEPGKGKGEDHPAVLDGREVHTGEWLESLNPATGSPVGRVAACGPEQVRAAVAGAVAVRDTWMNTPVAERCALLVATADILRRDRHSLAAQELFEVGKGWRDADADVAEAIDFLEYYADQMQRLSVPRQLGNYPGEDNRAGYLPRGVAAVIAPWNFPLAIPCGMVAAALVTGNPVVFKPSERAPLMGARLCAAFREAGAPDGVLQFVPGTGPDVGWPLVQHPEVELIAFTGSRAVGLAIHEAAARVSPTSRSVKRVIAEMGGKNALIVDETADLDEAAVAILNSALGFQGQKCSACSRVIVLDAVHDELVERLIAGMEAWTIGSPENPDNRIGPVIDARAQSGIRAYLEVGKSEGHLAYFARDVPGRGFYVGPALFTGIRPEHRLAQEEIFGPVIAVLRCRSLSEAVTVANGVDYALTGGLFSRSPAAIREVSDRMRVGNLYINREITGALVGRQPFGGFRFSGIGSKAGGEEYLPQFMVSRTVTENTLRRGFAPDAR
ncbi:MAG: proline dehydrogenase family protein [Nitrospirota bacterium]|nr:proline dehydrogenase family protein [Nitrospirota bacterium]